MNRTRMLRHALGLALEENSDGKAVTEIEYTFYAKWPNKLELQKASKFEHQEQWELKVPKTELNGGSGQIRVRKTIQEGGSPEFVLTFKTLLNAQGDRQEVSVPTTEPMFDQLRLLSDRGMRKDRYFFPVPQSDLVYEVDMYLLPDSKVGEGRYYEWCKIDLEVKSHTEQVPPFPFEVGEIITAQNGKRTTEEEALVRKLYDEVFLLKNQFQ